MNVFGSRNWRRPRSSTGSPRSPRWSAVKSGTRYFHNFDSVTTLVGVNRGQRIAWIV